MTTNKERREVASAMREEAQKWERVNHEWLFYGICYADPVLQDLMRFAGIEGPVKTSELFSRFADLIEPEPVCIANITITAEQIEEIKADVIKELEQPERTCKVEQDYDAMDDGVPDCRIWRCPCGEAFPYWRGCKPPFCTQCGANAVQK